MCACNLYVSESVNINGKTFEEETALLLACKSGRTDCVQKLLEAGADPNAATLTDITPLYEGILLVV